MSSGFWSGLAIAIPAIPVSIMLRSAGKRRALGMLEKREICRKWLEPEYAEEKLSDFGKNFIDGNYIDPSLTRFYISDTGGYLHLSLAIQAHQHTKRKQQTGLTFTPNQMN